MTKGSMLTRGLTAAQRHQFHKKLQEGYGHYWPYTPAPLKPTGWQRTYRAARRNALRARRMLHG